MYELFGFGSNSETQIPLDSSFFDLCQSFSSLLLFPEL